LIYGGSLEWENNTFQINHEKLISLSIIPIQNTK